MPELWLGSDGSLGFTAVPDADLDSIPPILPLDALEALGALNDIDVRSAREWSPAAMGFASEPEDGDALAAAMAGMHHDGSHSRGRAGLDDLLDPWAR
jgi:hypothetical protein